MEKKNSDPELLIGGLILLVVALFFGYQQFGDILHQVVAASTFQPVQAVIEHSEIDDSPEGVDKKQRMAMARITFRYEVAGKSYQSDRIAFSRPKTPEDVVQLVEFYKPGSKVTAYVDPDDPTVAILDKALPRVAQAVWSLLFIFALPIGLMYLGRPKTRRQAG